MGGDRTTGQPQLRQRRPENAAPPTAATAFGATPGNAACRGSHPGTDDRTDGASDQPTDHGTDDAARTQDMVDETATTDDGTGSPGNGDRPMTRTEAYRAARATRAASTASEGTREHEPRRGDGARSSARETAG